MLHSFCAVEQFDWRATEIDIDGIFAVSLDVKYSHSYHHFLAIPKFLSHRVAVIKDRIMMAKRRANYNRSSDCDNAANIRSSSLSRNRLSPRSTSIVSIVLLSMVAFSSLRSVRSFSPNQCSYSNDKLAKQWQNNIQFSSTINKQQPLHTPLGATVGDDSDEIEIEIETDDNIQNEMIAITGFTTPATTDKETSEAATTTSGTTGTTTILFGGTDDGYDGLGEYDPSENLPQTQREVPNVGDPQLRVKEKDWSVTNILKELAAIQQQGPQKYCILGTRHCSYLHQQIIELL